ncbi:hypothetical protein P154DRAFT_573340 [Amniculicola lignicola CBS 123094]|uniref:Uncharacterized protein n=1 Tax=Amniculicola lignicola CBS 123094 TaxID=1392246 RepID=A0A6A5WW82_9PLEO|nr:hypothetical protein P154DRAFT_573340 [Amniculicola lignicola CBS 123094]
MLDEDNSQARHTDMEGSDGDTGAGHDQSFINCERRGREGTWRAFLPRERALRIRCSDAAQCHALRLSHEYHEERKRLLRRRLTGFHGGHSHALSHALSHATTRALLDRMRDEQKDNSSKFPGASVCCCRALLQTHGADGVEESSTSPHPKRARRMQNGRRREATA